MRASQFKMKRPPVGVFLAIGNAGGGNAGGGFALHCACEISLGETRLRVCAGGTTPARSARVGIPYCGGWA